MTADDWEQCSRIAQELFAFGQAKAAEHGLVLVDTKYEMGRGENGEILLIDEIHTPDSSRYWIADSYQQRMREGQEPDNVDKEFLRLWFRENCNPYEDEVLPPAPYDLVIELSRRLHLPLREDHTVALSSFQRRTNRSRHVWKATLKESHEGIRRAIGPR